MLARVCLLLLPGALAAQEEVQPAYTFGTTVVDSGGLHGRVYHLERDTPKLPEFSRLAPAGSVYTSTLNVWPQRFREGFPNVTDRFEWFAIVYTGRIWIEKEGVYRFSLLADDGAKLKLNGKTVIENDGVHRAEAISGGAKLTRGVYEIEVEYFQGPRFTVALVLAVARPGEGWRIFHMDDFRPPQDEREWRKGKVSQIQEQTIR